MTWWGNVQAIYHKTPIIGIPVFGDQPDNVAKAVYRGIGLGMPPGRITADALAAAIIEVAEQPQYREAVTKLSKRMRAHRSTPVQQAGGEHMPSRACPSPLLPRSSRPCGHLPVLALLLSCLGPCALAAICESLPKQRHMSRGGRWRRLAGGLFHPNFCGG